MASPASVTPPLNLNQAIQYGMLVQVAEAVPPTQTVYHAGDPIKITYGATNVTYTVVTTFYANDLATDINPGRANTVVSFGFVGQDPAGNVVVSIRGTEGILEWVQDARFLAVNCPFLPGSGLTEDGFTSVYESLRTAVDPASPRLITALATLPYPLPVQTLTICGHSLGGAIATLFALDVAANAKFRQPTAYTYASPRTGDPSFADTYNQLVPQTYRIANRLDVVPKLPLPPLYEHVLGIHDLNPMASVKFDLLCEHHLTTYLNLLSRGTGGAVLPLNPECKGL
jgi:predicted lipase